MMKNKTKMLRLGIALAGAMLFIASLAFVGLFFGSSNLRENQDPAKQKEMLALVLEWGRLSPFPASATNISVITEGSSFSRSFRASFTAPKQGIESWIKNSPGLNETTPEKLSDNKVQYVIAPGGGANRAEVTIDYGLNQVEIYVSWG